MLSQETPRRILVKCGGFSSQLAQNVSEPVDGDPLWGSKFDCTNPEAVVKTHLDFLRNGANIILTNTYQSSVEGFMKYLQLSREQSIAMIAKSVELAQNAKKQHLEQIESVKSSDIPLVLASVGPFGAHLHDGSEYNGSYAEHVTVEQLKAWHRTRISTCLKAGVDGLAVETIPCQLEAEALTDLILSEYPTVKFWVSFQCKDEQHLAHGEDFAKAALAVWSRIKAKKATELVFGIGVNCLNPVYVAPLFKTLHAAANKDGLKERIPLLVYSNRGETYDSVHAAWTGSDKCKPLASYVPEWLQLGAVIIGGCCRVYPADILQIRKCVDNIGNNN